MSVSYELLEEYTGTRTEEMSDPTAEGFVPFDQLTEANVLEWVQGAVDVEAIESQLAAQIEQQKEPPIVTGLPWATNS